MHRGICAFVLAIGLALSWSAGALAQAPDSIRLTNGEWPPYMSKELEYGGLATRIVTEAFVIKGIQVKFGWFPWKRAFDYAQGGEWDGSVGWIRTPEREQHFYFSEPIFTGEMVFFHLKNYAFDWNTIRDLRGISIGATIGYGDYGEAFMKAEKAKSIEVHRVPTDKQNYSKLLLGRIKIFPLTREVGYNVLHKNFKPEEVQLITHHPKPIETWSYYLILSKQTEKSQYLLRIFNEGLRQLKETGKYDQYFEEARQGKYSK